MHDNVINSYADDCSVVARSRLYEDVVAAEGGDRGAVRLISVSQPGATDFHRCLPSRSDFVIESEVMLVATQRQLGLPLSGMYNT